VAKAIDTLRGHTQQTFGRALLTPGGTSPAGVSSFSADYQRFYNYGTVNQRFGPRTYLAYAQTTWQYDNPQNPVSNDLGIVSGGVRAFWVAINLPNTTNSFSFTPEVGATFRKLTGNGADNAVLMQQALGTTNTFFWGPELLVTIQVRQLSGFFKLTMLGKPNGATIDGLTGTQGIFGFALDAPIFVW
jgi:hypothetical protein